MDDTQREPSKSGTLVSRPLLFPVSWGGGHWVSQHLELQLLGLSRELQSTASPQHRRVKPQHGFTGSVPRLAASLSPLGQQSCPAPSILRTGSHTGVVMEPPGQQLLPGVTVWVSLTGQGYGTLSRVDSGAVMYVAGNSQSHRTKLLKRPTNCRTHTFNLVESSSGTDTREDNKARRKEGTTSWRERPGHSNPSAFVNPTQSLKGTETRVDGWRRSAPLQSILRNLQDLRETVELGFPCQWLAWLPLSESQHTVAR